MVLLRPEHLPHRVQGQLEAPDNNAAELRAALEALCAAPAAEALTIHTDNQAVIACLGRGRGPALLADLTAQVLAEAASRSIPLRVRYASRRARHLQQAHELANEARRGEGGGLSGGAGALALSQAEVVLVQKPAQSCGWVGLRRGTAGGRAERVSTQVALRLDSEMPPSVQLLLAAVALARPGETVQIRRASKLAQAMWKSPRRALRPGVQEELARMQQWAAEQGIGTVFV